jgi:inner membrane protein
MTAPTHSVFAMLLGSVVFSLFSYPLFKDPVGMGLVLVGGLLPDIDHPGSSIGRILFFISRPVERRWGHRTVTHSLVAQSAVGFLSMPLLFGSAVWWLCLSLGYFSHLIIDATNKSGTPLFWPSKSVCVFPYADRLRIATGSVKGEGAVLVILIVLLAMYMPVSNLGLFRAIRYLTASQRSAYTDYRSATTKTRLRFQGLLSESRDAISGTAPILWGGPYRFVILWQGRPYDYGESCLIIPGKSRVDISPDPVEIETHFLDGCPFSEIISDAGTALVSGTLTADRDFTCEIPSVEGIQTVRHSGRKIELEFAGREDLAGVVISRTTDPYRIQQLRMDIDILELEISDRRKSLPTEKLRALRRRCAVLEKSKESLLQSLNDSEDPVQRDAIRSALNKSESDLSRAQTAMSEIDTADASPALHLRKAMLKLTRFNLDLENAESQTVLFSGSLKFIKP